VTGSSGSLTHAASFQVAVGGTGPATVSFTWQCWTGIHGTPVNCTNYGWVFLHVTVGAQDFGLFNSLSLAATLPNVTAGDQTLTAAFVDASGHEATAFPNKLSRLVTVLAGVTVAVHFDFTPD
jgi:hypothetical protein